MKTFQILLFSVVNVSSVFAVRFVFRWCSCDLLAPWCRLLCHPSPWNPPCSHYSKLQLLELPTGANWVWLHTVQLCHSPRIFHRPLCSQERYPQPHHQWHQRCPHWLPQHQPEVLSRQLETVSVSRVQSDQRGQLLSWCWPLVPVSVQWRRQWADGGDDRQHQSGPDQRLSPRLLGSWRVCPGHMWVCSWVWWAGLQPQHLSSPLQQQWRVRGGRLQVLPRLEGGGVLHQTQWVWGPGL